MQQSVGARRFQHPVGPRADVGPQEASHSARNAAARAAARQGLHIEAKRGAQNVREGAQARVEPGNGRGVGAFLGREDVGRARGAVKGVGDVGGHTAGGGRQPRVHPRGVDAAHATQVFASGGHHAVVFVKKPVTQGRGQAQAAIGGGAAAHGEHEMAGSAVEGVGQQLARAQRGSAGGVALGRSQQFQAGGAGHFDDGGSGVGQPEVGGLDGPK